MDNFKLKALFDDFISNYQEEKINNIWVNQSAFFKNFWTSKVVNRSVKELNDFEIDEVVKIIDRQGKGNTSISESVARVMIPQGAWRRLFNQLKEDKELQDTINLILIEKETDKRAALIDRLYELNKNNKNNLTGLSGNAINSFLAAYNPFENLSVVSLKDRCKLIESLGSKYSSKSSIGNQIEETSNLIKEKFRLAGINNNARTISAFIYSTPFVNLWKTVNLDQTINSEDTYNSALNEKSFQEELYFYMEKQLEDFLIENWDRTDLGKKYDLINDDNGLVSQQYKTNIGIIDILAKDKIEQDRFIVIELKKNQTSDDTIGQIARYMGWVEEHLSNGVKSKGIIIAGKYDDKLKYAMRKIDGIEVYLYKVDFKLEEYNN